MFGQPAGIRPDRAGLGPGAIVRFPVGLGVCIAAGDKVGKVFLLPGEIHGLATALALAGSLSPWISSGLGWKWGLRQVISVAGVKGRSWAILNLPSVLCTNQDLCTKTNASTV